MAFFDDLGKTISNKSQNLTQKAKDVTEITKLNGQIIGYKNDLDKLYLELGKEYYQKKKTDTPYDDTELCTQISELQEQISICKEQIEKLKNNKKCCVCEAIIPFDATFCNTCGAKQPEQLICNKCETVVTDLESVYCPNCGNKLK